MFGELDVVAVDTMYLVSGKPTVTLPVLWELRLGLGTGE